MLEREQSGTMTPGIAADAPVQGGGSAQGVEPLVASGAFARCQSRAPSIGFKVGRLLLA
jgi:hypothetical protein